MTPLGALSFSVQKKETHTETERDTQTDTHRQTHTDTHTETHRDTHTQRHTERHTQRDTQRETHRDTERHRERETPQKRIFRIKDPPSNLHPPTGKGCEQSVHHVPSRTTPSAEIGLATICLWPVARDIKVVTKHTGTRVALRKWSHSLHRHWCLFDTDFRTNNLHRRCRRKEKPVHG